MTLDDRQQLITLLLIIYDLQSVTWTNEKITKPDAFAEVIRQAQLLGITLEPTDPQFLPTMAAKIWEELVAPPEQPAPNIDPTLLKQWREYLEKSREEQKIKITKLLLPDFDLNRQIRNAYRVHRREIAKILISLEPKLGQVPEIVKEISWRTTVENINNLPVSRPEAFLEEEYKKIILQTVIPTITQELKKLGIEKTKIEKDKEIVASKIATQTYKFARVLVITPHAIVPVEKIMQLEKPPSPPAEIPPLPEEVLTKLAEKQEEVIFLPVYTLLQPKVAAVFVKRIIYTLPAKILKIASSEATPEWQEMVEKGLFVEDIQVSIEVLKAMGVPEEHPLIKNLEDKASKFFEEQKRAVKRKDGTIIYYKDTLAARILKHYYHFSKITGRKRIFSEDLKTFLPRLSPQPGWVKKQSYSYYLYRGLSKFGFVIRGWRELIRFFSGGKYESLKPIFKLVFYQKTLKPIFVWLGKTAVGKVITTGVRKTAVWIAAKLGIKIAAGVGIAVAGGPPGWVIALAMVGVDLLKYIGKKFIGLIREIVQKPEKALAAIGVGVLASIFIHPLVGIVPIVFGAIGIFNWVFAPPTLGVIAGKITAFFSAVSTIPFAAPIILFVVILFSTLAALTLFVVMVASGAFILPTLPTTPVVPPSEVPFVSLYFDVIKTVSPKNTFKNEELPVMVTYGIAIRVKEKKLKWVKVEDGERSWTVEEITDSWVQTYERTFDESFKDKAITNTVTVTAEVEGETGRHQGMASATVIIGNPPMDCPSGWPVKSDDPYISNVPGYASHSPGRNDGVHDQEAVDLAIPVGYDVYATHQGTVGEKLGGGCGIGISIKGICNNLQFRSVYCHLSSLSVRVGQEVKPGDKIGVSGNTGISSGAHVHYEFKPVDKTYWDLTGPRLKMAPPYVPIPLPPSVIGKYIFR